MKVLKQYARRSLAGFVSPYTDPFVYRRISELGTDQVQEALSRAGCPDSLQALIDFAGEAFDPSGWELAFEPGGGELVGTVFAQRYWDKLEEGSIFHLGLVHERRGQRLGRILHAHGLEKLASQGVQEYVGSTEVENQAMIATFLANGCRLTRVLEADLS